MRRTHMLAVFVNSRLETGILVMHPNDGFDLGLMHDRYSVTVHMKLDKKAARDPFPGAVQLNNSCRSGTLEVSQKQWELMHKQEQVVLAIKDTDVFIVADSGGATS
ncbi:MAG: hypothetical protein EHM28_10095 [Spirochaetaceae bacterium]|nr:MAG: hypothetical protein EHM28_10095 [Spirochaetaceae bacterium]